MTRHASPATRQAAKAAAAERETRKRWYITINARPAPRFVNRFGQLAYVELAWPKLFESAGAAWDFARAMTAVPGKGIWTPPPGADRVVSYALSTTYLPKEAA